MTADDMVLVPAGPFVQGSDEFDIEGPPRRVDLPSFWIDRYPVTNEAYLAFVRATGHTPPPDWPGGRPPEGREDHPV